MGTRARLGTTAASLLALLAGVPRLRAQAPQPIGPDLLPAQQVEVVRVEVVVTEKRGRPKTGLKREDFAVFEDGQPQQVVQFLAFARPEPSAPAAAVPPRTAEETAPEEMLPARYVVLAIDDVHMEIESLNRARKALARFLKEDLRPEDQVALVTTSGGSALSQEFTSDRAVLQQILSRLSVKGRQPAWTGVPYITEYQAELIEAGDPLALDAAVQEVMLAGTFQDAGSAEEIARRKARGIVAEAGYDARLTLEAIESLCRGLSGLTGRKALFLVSDGFLTGMSARSGRAFDVRRIADAGTRAGVAIYALDTRGLVASAPGMAASSRTRALPTTFGSIEAMRRQSEEATRDAMHALAADTGGFLVENANDLRAGLLEFLKDTETYYVLAYEPANRSRDGAFRRIEVRLPGLADLKVRTRSGYFAPRASGADEMSEDAARRQEQRQSEMRTALLSLAPLTGIPVRLSADFVSLDGRATQLVVTGNVDVSTLPFARLPGHRRATIETAALVYDEAGALAATLETERTAMDVADADYEQLARSGVPYQRAVVLGPGRYRVRLAAREDATGLLGSVWRRVEVPDLAPGRLALSSLFLLREGVPPATPAAPDAGPVLNTVQALPRFSRTESLYLQLQAYNPKRDASGAIDLVAQAEVLRGGVVVGTAAPEPMVEGEPPGTVPHVSRIRLQRFEPGEYELRVTVNDRNASTLATRVAAFTIEETGHPIR
ncbi:MAG TPA: VWA domain-containing protein [Vicinamibacteria bacterium]|nr:VWA domain-containing protein [Vicinamibacteria bacterium]